MLQDDLVRDDLAQRDAAYVAALTTAIGRVVRLWFRSEVRDMARLPDEGGALIVSNHSGGLMAVDVPIVAAAFVEQFGPDRPFYVMVRDVLLDNPAGAYVRRCGFLADTPANVDAVLSSGGVTMVFPGGDYEATRPTSRANVIDFGGNTDYVSSALDNGVPLVPVVSIGGQEAQLHLSRGALLAKLTRVRLPYLPVTFGFPFGLSAGVPPNLPLPTKITTQVLDPIDVGAEFGPDPDVSEVDEVVRGRMQDALDELKRQRRFPVLG